MTDFEKREKCGWLTRNQLAEAIKAGHKKHEGKVCGRCGSAQRDDFGMECDHNDHQFATHRGATCNDWSKIE
jgi:hypothetical protein